MRESRSTPKAMAVAGLGCAATIMLLAAAIWFAELHWRRTLPPVGPRADEAPAASAIDFSPPTHLVDELRGRLDRPPPLHDDGWPTSSTATPAAAAASAVPPIDPNHLELVVLKGPNGLVAMVNGERVTGKTRLRDGSRVLSLSEEQLVLQTVDGVAHRLRLNPR